ncbi:2-oxoacid:acceptor oxidoreductase subunit alpha [Methanopyrus sp.]
MSKVDFLQGNEACAEGAIVAGCRFFAGYPITPSTEIAERMSSRLPEVGGVYVQMEDEIASLAAVIGASWAGIKAMTATAGPGFSLMQEHIGYAVMTETPCVVVNVQRGGPSTGQPTKASQSDVMQVRWGSHGDYEIVALSPSTVQEMYDLMIECFNWSERLRVPAVLLTDEVVGHMRERVVLRDDVETVGRELPPEGEEIEKPFPMEPDDLVPPMPVFGRGHRVHVTGLTHDERGYPATDDPEIHRRLVTRLCNKVRKRAREIHEEVGYDFEERESDVALVAYGGCARTVIEAAEELGVTVFRPKVIHPFDPDLIRDLLDGYEVLVVEMNLGQYVEMVERALDRECVHLLGYPGGYPPTPERVIREVKKLSG